LDGDVLEVFKACVLSSELEEVAWVISVELEANSGVDVGLKVVTSFSSTSIIKIF